MPETGIPSDVQQFITKHIRSVEQLEVLLLVSNAPDRSWSVDAVQAQIQSNTASVRNRLDELTSMGLLIREAAEAYRYMPQTPELRQKVSSLATVYKERRIRVIQLIFSRPIDEVRSFADAFKIRKEKDNG